MCATARCCLMFVLVLMLQLSKIMMANTSNALTMLTRNAHTNKHVRALARPQQISLFISKIEFRSGSAHDGGVAWFSFFTLNCHFDLLVLPRKPWRMRNQMATKCSLSRCHWLNAAASRKKADSLMNIWTNWNAWKNRPTLQVKTNKFGEPYDTATTKQHH